MKVTEQKAEGLKKKYQVVIENKDFEAKVEKKLNEIAKNVKLPGFRPGKAPKEMLKQKYRASVMGEALDEAVREAADEVVSRNKLKLALRPNISITSFDDGKDIEFDMEAEVLPEIKVGDFSAVSVEKLMAEVPESEVEKALQYIVSSRRETVKVEDAARRAQKGDTLVIDFVGTVNGEEFKGGKGNDYPLELGSNTFIPGFEDQLENAAAGDKIDVKVKFPDNYHAKDLAGKDAVFAVTVKEIREPKEVEVNDEFAKTVGAESLDALKDSIRNRIKADYENASRLKLKRALLDKLDEAYDFAVPESLVDEEFKSIEAQYKRAKELNQLDEHEKSTPENELMEEYKKIASRRVKLGLLLSEAGAEAKVTVTADDLNKAIMNEAKKYPGQEKTVFDFYLKNAKAVEALRAPVFEEKIIDYVLGKCKVEEKIVSVEELYAFDDDAKPAKKESKAGKAEKPAKKKTKQLKLRTRQKKSLRFKRTTKQVRKLPNRPKRRKPPRPNRCRLAVWKIVSPSAPVGGEFFALNAAFLCSLLKQMFWQLTSSH